MYVNAQQIMPMPVIMGKAEYPERIIEKLQAYAGKVKAIDGLKLAEESGTDKAVNVVLLGAASNDMPFSDEEWLSVIEENVKPKFIDINKTAFEKGKKA